MDMANDRRIRNYYCYDAFGESVISHEDIHNRFRFNGEQYDPVTSQYYLRARFYNPVIGRFTQEDTYYGDGLNLYEYCRNNPVFYRDPSGHDVCPAQYVLYKQFREAGMTPQQAWNQMCLDANLSSIIEGLKNADIIYKKNPKTGVMEPYMKQYIVNDNYKILLRKDFGDFNDHDKRGDHWNLEVQTAGGRTVYDLHVYVDKNGGLLPFGDDNIYIPKKSPFNKK